MKPIFSLLAVALLATAAWGQAAAPPQQVQLAEVLRRGDMVTSMGEGPRSAPDEAFAAAMKPPVDDSHLWKVAVWTTPNCPACEKLKADFRKAPELLAYVAAPAPALPWAHYVEYSGADETQKDRREKYRVTSYPVIVVQPPRNGMWGDPGMVVFYDTGYKDAKTLATKMQKSLRKFTAVQQRKGFPKMALAAPRADAGGAGQAPFPTPPKPDQFNPNTVPAQPLQWPPADETSLDLPLSQIAGSIGRLLSSFLPSGTTMIVILLLLQSGLMIWEARAKQTPSQWDDKVVAFLRSLIGKDQSPPSPGPAPPAMP